jgi:hypothetical protein
MAVENTGVGKTGASKPVAIAPGGILKQLGIRYSQRHRSQRAALFRSMFRLTERTRVCDLGGGNGAHINMVLSGTPVRPENVYIADCNDWVHQSSAFGFRPVLVPAEGRLPFEDGEFDVVFCSSVIEHLTVPRPEWYTLKDSSFARRSLPKQRAFADEIRRIGRAYWVQTPAREFFLETHSWLPFIHWLPRRAYVDILSVTRHFWLSKHAPNWHLLTREHMEAMFPEARIVAERSLGMAKSWIAVRTE